VERCPSTIDLFEERPKLFNNPARADKRKLCGDIGIPQPSWTFAPFTFQ
jgi:hypothetical protein